jgi:hypothetical protein
MDELASRRRPWRTRLLGIASGVVLAAAGIGAYQVLTRPGDDRNAAATPSTTASQKVPPIVSSAGLAQRNGIRIVHVAVTGGGGLLDLRYQVLDPDKAGAVHLAPPEMVDERSDAVVDNLLMGHQHRGVLHAGQTYYLIFLNPGNLVTRGDRVTVALGGLRVRHVVVR